MPNTKDIKNRIKSVGDTKKITNAMYLIASTKLRHAKAALDETRPFFEALNGEMADIYSAAEEIDSKYLAAKDIPDEDKKYALLLITADKGLAGPYNLNAIKKAERFIEKHPNTRLFVVGENGRQYCRRKGIKYEHDFLFSAQNPNIYRARKIGDILLKLYDEGEVNRIYIIYTDMKNQFEGIALKSRLLPQTVAKLENIDDEDNEGRTTISDSVSVTEEYEFYPNATAVVDSIIPAIFTGYLYSALTDSFCAEQSARMNAMQAANRNADEILEELNAEYNRVRQGVITQEITEISAGARSQKKKLKKALDKNRRTNLE